MLNRKTKTNTLLIDFGKFFIWVVDARISVVTLIS